MRINVYSQELTSEVAAVEKESNTGRVYKAAQLILHSSEKLHHPPEDDDRSAVTFWLPSSPERCESMAQAFEKIAKIFRSSNDEVTKDEFMKKVMENPEAYRGQGIRFRPPYGREVISLEQWLDEQSADHKPSPQVQA